MHIRVRYSCFIAVQKMAGPCNSLILPGLIFFWKVIQITSSQISLPKTYVDGTDEIIFSIGKVSEQKKRV